MLSINCPVDFDSELWSGFDTAMSEEWNITATTTCHEVDVLPSSIYGYRDLANKILMERNANSTTTAGRPDFTTYINALLGQSALDVQKQQVVFLTKHSNAVFQFPLASGVAYPTENIAFVRNNFGYSTGTLSHEILHLVLEEQGYDKSCYAEMVHEHQFKYSLKKIGDNMRPVVKKFDCPESTTILAVHS